MPAWGRYVFLRILALFSRRRRQRPHVDPVVVVTRSTCGLCRLLREKRARILRNTYLPHAGKDRLPRLAIEAGKTIAGMRRSQGVAGLKKPWKVATIVPINVR